MSRSRRVLLVTALVTGLGAPPVAEAGPAAPTTVAARTASTHQARKARKARTRKARKPARRRTNMPDGWAWPPSKQMVAAGKACTAELDALGIAWKPARKQRKVGTPITLADMELGGVKLVSVFRRGPHVMDCHLALGLARQLPPLYERGLRELHFSRIYGYTRVRTGGRQKRALSRHALGLAIDVRAFVDDTGRKAVVLDDYPRGDELLLEVEQVLTDSGGFRTLLTPRNDPESHDDHFHMEVRVDYTRPLPRRPGA